MLFSIIVPVYNVKNFLSKCLDSILAQTYTDFEIVIVDDGSNDGSSDICELFSQQDKRVKLFHKSNGGLSDARNYGINCSSGEYLVFIDSDDWIKPDSLMNLKEATIDNPQVIISTFIEFFENNKSVKVNDSNLASFVQDKSLNKRQIVDWVCWQSKNTWPAQKYIVSRKFIKEKSIRFQEGRLHEDMDWTSRLLYHATKFSFMVKPWYYHRIGRKGAITTNINVKHFTDMIEMAKEHSVCPEGIDEEIHSEVFNRFMCSLYAWLRYTKGCSKEDIAIVSNCIKNNMQIFNCRPKMWNYLFVVFLKLFGVKFALRLFQYSSLYIW